MHQPNTHKRRLLHAIIACAGVCLLTRSAIALSPPIDRVQHVLFIGNSLTYMNAMPDTFARVVEYANPGLRVAVEYVTGDGATLEDMWTSKWAMARLKSRRWDYVVLQEQGGLSSRTYHGKTVKEDPVVFFKYAKLFTDIVHASGGKTVLYETAPSSGGALSYVDYAYVRAANETGSILAPVGRVMDALATGEHADGLISKDGHPSVLGSCIVAGTLAGAIYGSASADVSSCAGDDKAAITLTASIRDQLAFLKKSRPYVGASAPAFEPAPLPVKSTSLDIDSLFGTWVARDSGLPLSFGMKLVITKVQGKISVHGYDYGADAVLNVPLKHVSDEGGVLSLSGRWNNRDISLALTGATRSGVAELTGVAIPRVGAHSMYSDITFASEPVSDPYFNDLDRIDAQFQGDIKKFGFDEALLRRFKNLSNSVGQAAFDTITLGGALVGEGLAIMSGDDYTSMGEPERALEYYRFGAKHFPDSPYVHASLSNGLEQVGKIADAYKEVCIAENLLKASHASGVDPDIAWQKQHLETLLHSTH